MGDFDFLSREKHRKWVILTFPRVGKAGFFRFLMKPVAGFASRGLFLQKPVADFASRRSAQHERMRNAPLFHEHLQSSTHNFHTFIY